MATSCVAVLSLVLGRFPTESASNPLFIMAYSKEPITPDFFRKSVEPHVGGGKTRVSPDSRGTEPISRLKPTMCCDFCGDDVPVFVYHAIRRSDGRSMPPGAKAQRWAACQSCSQMVDADQWESLEEKMTKRFQHYFQGHINKKTPPIVIKELISRSLQDFHDFAIRLA